MDFDLGTVVLFNTHVRNQMARARYNNFKNLPSDKILTADNGKKFSLDIEKPAPVTTGSYLKILNEALSWPSGKKRIKLPVSTYFLETPEELQVP